MALIGIVKTDTFDYVSNSDPCKRVVAPPPSPGVDPASLAKETVIDEGATHFKLGVLDVFLMGMIYDKSTKMTRNTGEGESQDLNILLQVNATNIETVRFGLRGWSNFTDGTGSDLAFGTIRKNIMGREYEVCSDATLNLLGIQLIQELGNEIKQASEVTRTDAKNTAPVS